MKVLATKKLKVNQRDLLLSTGCSLVDYDAIAVEIIDFDSVNMIQNAIFTSQHSVHALTTKKTTLMNCFCVGAKTKALLEENGQKVIKMAQNSKELGEFLVNFHKNETFYYFCGSHRRDELPNLLKMAKIEFFEVKTYNTELKPKKFDQHWDAIMFFSPSGVQSFCIENNLASQTAVCIGETTAKTAREYTNEVYIANATTIESVIAKTVKILNIKNS